MQLSRNVPEIDEVSLLRILSARLTDEQAQEVLTDLLNDSSWLRVRGYVLIEIEAAGEVSDSDTARLLDILNASERLAEVSLVSSGTPASFRAQSHGPEDTLSAHVWHLAEVEGLDILDVRIQDQP